MSTNTDSTHLHIGNETQMLMDDILIEEIRGMTRKWHKLERHGNEPLITHDRAWEEAPYFRTGNTVVLRDPKDGLFKCWYEDLGPVRRNVWGRGNYTHRTRMLYAESTDGIHFRKPELDICLFDGKPTNILMGYMDGKRLVGREDPMSEFGVHSHAVVIDPAPPSPDERFRAMFTKWRHDPDCRVMACAHSSDGLRWKYYNQSPMLGSSGNFLGDVVSLHYDDLGRMFVANTRHGRMAVIGAEAMNPFQNTSYVPAYYPHRSHLMNKRRIYQGRSADLLNWTELLPVVVPDDDFDNIDESYYGMQQFMVGRIHFANLCVFRECANEVEVRLLHSRDGIHFKTADRGAPFLAPRGPGHWDAYMAENAQPPIEINGEWWFYYCGSKMHHDWWCLGSFDHPEAQDPGAHFGTGLGLTRLRKEGFASLVASPVRDGYFITKPLNVSTKDLEGDWEGKQGADKDADDIAMRHLLINAKCGSSGMIRVGLLNPDNSSVAGYSLEDCIPFTGDSTDHPVAWKGLETMDAKKLSGKWCKVVFWLRNAEIFSFRFSSKECKGIRFIQQIDLQ